MSEDAPEYRIGRATERPEGWYWYRADPYTPWQAVFVTAGGRVEMIGRVDAPRL